MSITHDLAALAPIGPLTGWLDAHVPQLGKGPLETAILSGGTSNVVLTIARGGKAMVLRRPPVVPPPGAEKGVLREARILTALGQTDVPHPHCYGACDDASVIGAPFYVMEKVEGWAPNLRDEKIHNEPPFDKMPYVWRIPYAIVDGPDNWLPIQSATPVMRRAPLMALPKPKAGCAPMCSKRRCAGSSTAMLARPI
jgi:hypothetical protein